MGVRAATPTGVKALDSLDNCLDFLRGGLDHAENLLGGGLEIAVVVHVADDHVPDGQFLFGKVGKAHLPVEMPFQGRLGGQAGLEGQPLFRDFEITGRGLLRGAGEFAQIVFPVCGADQFLFGLGLGHLLLFPHLGLSFALIEKRVLHEFLLNRLQKLKTGELQQLDRLLQLGRHDQLLGKLELLSEFQSHLLNSRAVLFRLID